MASLRSLTIRSIEAMTHGLGGARLLVLIWHRVLPQSDPFYPWDPDVASFRRYMRTLRDDFNVLPLAEALERLRRDALPPRAVAISFDDGFADNCTQALPVLQEFGLPATFFIASAYLDGGCMFNDAVIAACRHAPGGEWDTGVAVLGRVAVSADRPALAYRMIAQLKYLPPEERMEAVHRLLDSVRTPMPIELMMTTAQLRALRAAGMEIGGHTRTHPILARVDDAQARDEISGGKADLEGRIDAPLRLFAYPNGQPDRDYTARDVRLVAEAGFDAALTTAWGFADRDSTPMEIPRVGSWGDSAWRFSGRLALARSRQRGASCAPVFAGVSGP